MARYLRSLMALVAVLAVGCSDTTAPNAGEYRGESDRDETQAAAPAASPAPSQPAAQQAGLLDFTAPAVGGGQLAGADYAGRDLALWFWAPW